MKKPQRYESKIRGVDKKIFSALDTQIIPSSVLGFFFKIS
jgi:hypothetical protein